MMKLKIWSMLIVALGILAASGSQAKAAPMVPDPEVVSVRQSDTISHRAALQTNKKSVCGYTLVGKTVELYEQLKGPKGFLGCPTSNTKFVGDYLGLYTNFEGGVIYAHPVHGAHEVHGLIWIEYNRQKGLNGCLGYPTSNEMDHGEGRISRFQHGHITWSQDEGVQATCNGKKLPKPRQIPDRHYKKEVCGYLIYGSILKLYEQFGGKSRWLGCPVSGMGIAPDGEGMFVHFRDASIYWHPDVGTFEIHGAIRTKWASLGWERRVGYPIANQQRTTDEIGRYSHLEKATIFWHPDIGAFEVHGLIRDRYDELGWEESCLGYPISDEEDYPLGRISWFEHGNIIYDKYDGEVRHYCRPTENPNPPASPSPKPPTPQPKNTPPPPTSQLAELAFTGVSGWIEPSLWPRSGEPITAKFNYCNFGNLETGDFSIKFTLDGGSTRVDSPLSLAPGQCKTARASWLAGVTPGSHKVEVFLDVNNSVAEVYENNNYNYIGFSTINSSSLGAQNVPSTTGQAELIVEDVAVHTPSSDATCQLPTITQFYAALAPPGSAANYTLYYEVVGASKVQIFGTELNPSFGKFDVYNHDEPANWALWTQAANTPDDCILEKVIRVTPVN